MNSNEQFKQTNLIYLLIGFILPMFLIIYVSAEQPTIKELAEQAIDWTVATTENWTTMSWETIDKWIKLSTEWIKKDWPSNNQNTQWWVEKTVSDCDKIVMHNDHATEVAIFMCKIYPEKKMLAAFNQESWMNEWARGSAGEYWICQLMPNRTNLVWINDPRWNDWKRQATKCVEKYLAVPVNNRAWIWSSIWSNAYKKYLYLFE